MINNPRNFNTIYSKYKVLVYNVALNYLQNCEDAEEIVQDVFVQIHHSLNQFDDKSALQTWIYRITINKSLDFIKQKNSKKRFFMFGRKSNDELELQNISDFEHPGILLENKEKSILLFGVINELSENQKTAFILSKLDGLSNPEISEIMQLSISAVESLVFRAKLNLRAKLSNKFMENHKKNK